MIDSKIFLSMEQVSELEQVGYDAIRMKVQRGRFKVTKILVDTRQGFEYRISLDQLTEKAQRRYYAEQRDIALKENEQEQQYKNITVESLTDKQRAEIEFWKKVTKNWQAFISEYPKQKTQKTKEFVHMWNITNPDQKISVRTLNRKFEKQKEYGDIALTDLRLQNSKKGKTAIDEAAWDVFLQWYLDEAQPGVKTVYDIVKVWAELEMPELLPLPSEACFYRAVKKIPDAVIKYYRYGNTAFENGSCIKFSEEGNTQIYK